MKRLIKKRTQKNIMRFFQKHALLFGGAFVFLGLCIFGAHFVSRVLSSGIDSYTGFVMHGNENAGTTVFFDSSPTPKTISTYGNVVATTTGKFSNSLYFDGTGDYLKAGATSDWQFGTSAFTIDFWMRTPNASPSTHNGFVSFGYDSNGMTIFFQGSTFYVYSNSSGSWSADISFVHPFVANTWHHVAIVRDSTSLRVYIDGTLKGSNTSAAGYTYNAPSGAVATIGRLYNSTDGYYFNGYIDEFRISKGIARWTANFTPPTGAYTAESGDGADGACTVATSVTSNLNTSSCSGRATADAVNFSVAVSTASGQNQVTLSTTPTGLAVGDEVMIINLQGNSSSYASVGQYEIKTITGISSNTLTLDSNLTNAYDGTTQKIMVQRVPNYTNVTISSGGTLTAEAWNGTKNGVLAIRANGTITNGGTITMSGKGFRGGAYDGADAYGFPGESYNYYPSSRSYSANLGGGGGMCKVSGTWGCGSGGAGYGTAGTTGAVSTAYASCGTGGYGGSIYGTSTLATMFFGSGGGGTLRPNTGGVGGGIVFIDGYTISNSGYITSGGSNGSYDSVNGDYAGGGGGAGGSIRIEGNTIALGSYTSASGGTGGVTPVFSCDYGGCTTCQAAGNCKYGDGSAGGAGRIAVYYKTSLSGSTSPTMYSLQVSDLPSTPGTPTFSSTTQSTTRISWTAGANATSYKIERAPDSSGSPGTYTQIASGVTNLYYDDSGLSVGNTYWYRVRGTNGTGDGSYSSAGSVTTFILAINSIDVSYSTTTGVVGPDGACVLSGATIDSYTKLFLQGDGAAGATTFVDSSASGRTITTNGNTVISATTAKSGNSIYLDGSGDYLTAPTSDDFNFGTSDFTVDWWEYRTSSGSYGAVLSRDDTSSYSPFIIGYYSGGNLLAYLTSSGSSWDIANQVSMGAVTLNTWVHFALVRNGSNFYTFRNGTLVSSWTSSGSVLTNSNPLSIGKYSTTYFAGGYIDNLRVSKGIARWTSNFTPDAVNLNTSSCSGRATADAVNFSVAVSTASGQNQVTLSTTPTGLAVGDEVMIINLQGTSAANSAVGQYEIKKITNISSNTLTLDSNLTNAYDGTTQKIMVQRVPNYTTVTIPSGMTLTASAWDGTKGGVLAFKASESITNNGTITMSGSGYRPGATYISSTGGYQGEGYGGVGVNTASTARLASNYGGGGASWDSGYNSGLAEGGGGGGYGTVGTAGTNSNASWTGVGAGGNATGTQALATMFMGPAGGAGGCGYNGSWYQGNGTTDGKGGAGGGIIFMQAPTFTNSGSVSANGATGYNGWGYTTSCGQSICGGGGGSGAGGSIYINAQTATLGSSAITATGGATTYGGGGSYGNGWVSTTGGAGGSGRIAVYYSGSAPSGTTNPTMYSAVGNMSGASKKIWKVDGTNTFTITQMASSSVGVGGSYGLISLINYQGDNAGQYGGEFAWHPSSYIFSGNQVACSGSGGYASQNNSAYGWGTSDLISCASSISGSSYTITFTIRPTASFPEISANDISGFASDASSNTAGWTNFNLNFASDRSAPSISSISPTCSGDRTVTTLAVNATDTASGITGYSFDGGNTWQTANSSSFGQSGNASVSIKDGAGFITSYGTYRYDCRACVYTTGTATTSLVCTDPMKIPTTSSALSTTTPSSTSWVYTSDVIDMGSAPTLAPTLTWSEHGSQTGDGETLASTTGLIAKWDLNSTSGTSAVDASGNGNHGTLTNFASTGSQDALPNSGWTANNRKWGAGALAFDGTNDSVIIPTNSLTEATSSITISAWVNFSALTNSYYSIFDHRGGTNLYEFYYDNRSGYYRITLALGGSSIYSSTFYPKIGEWYYVVAQGTIGQSVGKIYINGIDVTSSPGTAPSSVTGGASTIGAAVAGSAEWFSGIIDSVSLYNRILSASEVLSNYQAGNVEFQTRTGNSSSIIDGTWEAWKPSGSTIETTLDTFESGVSSWLTDMRWNATSSAWEAGTVSGAGFINSSLSAVGSGAMKISAGRPVCDANTTAFWTFDETSGTTARDMCGTNHGTASGSTIVNGKIGNARSFNGSGDYVSIPDTDAVNFGSGNFSISFWINPSGSGRRAVFSQGPSTGASKDYPIWLEVDANNKILTIYGDGSTYYANTATTNAVTNGSWNHVALVRTGNVFNVYVNGVLGKSETFAITLANPTDSFMIGRGGNYTSYYFNGLIDEFQVSKGVAFSALDVSKMYTLGMGKRFSRTISSADIASTTMMSYWFAGDRTGSYITSMYGESAYANYEPSEYTKIFLHGDEVNGSTAIFDSSAYGIAMTTNGNAKTSSLGKIGNSMVIDGAESSYFNGTLSDTIGTSDYSADVWVNFSSIKTYNSIFEFTGGTGPMFRLQNGSLYGCYNNYFTFTPTIGTWYHIACTRSGGIEKTYVNGVLMKTYSGSTASHTSAVLRVGEVWDSSSAYNFNGYIDELRIEKGICRSAEEIRQAYEVGKRMHPVIVEFGTNPSSAYTAGATTIALSSVSGLNIGDTMIVSESVASGTNIEERVVTNISGTTVTLASGFSNSYSTSSRVFKWQEEFMDTTAPLGTHKDSTTRMTFLVTNGSEGRNVWIDDIKTSSGYLSAPSSTQNVTSGLKRFLQFRAIFTRSDTSINPYVTNVLLDWSGAGGPTLDQLMRHGQSFLNQVRQTFYFINIRSILGF